MPCQASSASSRESAASTSASSAPDSDASARSRSTAPASASSASDGPACGDGPTFEVYSIQADAQRAKTPSPDAKGKVRLRNAGLGIQKGISFTLNSGPPPSVMAFEARIARNGRGRPESIVQPLKAQSGRTGKGDSAPWIFSSPDSPAKAPASPASAADSRTIAPRSSGKSSEWARRCDRPFCSLRTCRGFCPSTEARTLGPFWTRCMGPDGSRR